MSGWREVEIVNKADVGDVSVTLEEIQEGLCEKHGIILTWPEKYAGTLAALALSLSCDT